MCLSGSYILNHKLEIVVRRPSRSSRLHFGFRVQTGAACCPQRATSAEHPGSRMDETNVPRTTVNEKTNIPLTTIKKDKHTVSKINEKTNVPEIL